MPVGRRKPCFLEDTWKGQKGINASFTIYLCSVVSDWKSEPHRTRAPIPAMWSSGTYFVLTKTSFSNAFLSSIAKITLQNLCHLNANLWKFAWHSNLTHNFWVHSDEQNNYNRQRNRKSNCLAETVFQNHADTLLNGSGLHVLTTDEQFCTQIYLEGWHWGCWIFRLKDWFAFGAYNALIYFPLQSCTLILLYSSTWFKKYVRSLWYI